MGNLNQLAGEALTQIASVFGDDTPAVAVLAGPSLAPMHYVLHDYWPCKTDRALALGQAATVEMTIGGDAVAKGARSGILMAHVVVPRAAIDFADETGLSWRRLEDEVGLDYRETEALLGFAFDVDEGFEILVIPLTRSGGVVRFAEPATYVSPVVREPLPGLILMRIIAENAPVREYQ